jgi:predicted DNA-binding protein YlxM (UPF0122 family)
MNLHALFLQGRAKSPFELWSPAENELVHEIAQKRGVSRTQAADYVRNGVSSLEEYDKAVKAKFKPKDLNEAVAEAVQTLSKTVKKAVKGKRKK